MKCQKVETLLGGEKTNMTLITKRRWMDKHIFTNLSYELQKKIDQNPTALKLGLFKGGAPE